MLLTVIVPDKSPGMERMLQKELAGIEAEVIKKSWARGIKKAKGDFICLLEENSAVSPGTIKRNLEEFVLNPKYRKLAMVSPMVDLPSIKDPVAWTFARKSFGRFGGLAAKKLPANSGFQSVRVGQAYGAIIRKSSLLKSSLLKPGIPFRLHPYAFLTALSIYFWENGLRIAIQPESIYYAPEGISYKYRKRPKAKPKPSDTVWTIWEREMIP